MAWEDRDSENLSQVVFEDEDLKYKVLEICPLNRFRKFNDQIDSSPLKTVHRGYDADNGREVQWHAIRVRNIRKADISRIQKELAIFKSLSHENILNCIDYWYKLEDREIVFVTEMVSGSSLKSYLAKIKTTKLRIIKNWAQQILRGLVYLHQQPVPRVHQSLRCDNVYINSTKNQIKIGELGLLYTSSDPFKSASSWLEWSAPEMADGIVTPASDVYSFGVTLLEMATGKRPYSECLNHVQLYRHIYNQIKPQTLSGLQNPQLKQIIEICMSFNPQNRPSSRELLAMPFWKTNEELDQVAVKSQPESTTEPRHLLSKQSKQSRQYAKVTRLSDIVQRKDLDKQVKFTFDFGPRRKFEFNIRRDQSEGQEDWINFVSKRLEDRPGYREDQTHTLSNNPTMKTSGLDYLYESRVKEDDHKKSTINLSEANQALLPEYISRVVEAFNGMYDVYRGSLDAVVVHEQFYETRFLVEKKELEQLQNLQRERQGIRKKGNKYNHLLMNSYNLIDILNNLETGPAQWASDASELEKDLTFKHTLARHQDVLSLNLSSIFNYKEETHTDIELENARFYDLLENGSETPKGQPAQHCEPQGHASRIKVHMQVVKQSQPVEAEQKQKVLEEEVDYPVKAAFEKRPSAIFEKQETKTSPDQGST